MLGEGPGDDGCRTHVCEQHVLLDKEVGVCLHVGAGRHGVATRVQCEVEACVVQAQGARLEARIAQAGGDAVEGKAIVFDLHNDHIRWNAWCSFKIKAHTFVHASL